MTITDEDLKYLREAGCSEEVIRHSIQVAEKSLQIAESMRISIDRNILKMGALNHDIGRSKTNGVDHIDAGVRIASEKGIDKRVIRIIERHIGSGIPRDEAIQVGLKAKDYIPETPEEVIVAYVDNLVWNDHLVTFEEALESFRKRFGQHHPAVERFIEMHQLIELWMEEK